MMRQRTRTLLFFAAVATAAVAAALALRSAGLNPFADREPVHIHNNLTWLDGEVMRYIPFTDTFVGCNNRAVPSRPTHLNNAGFRDDDFRRGQQAVGIFGDSFVFGYCLPDEDTIDRHLAAALTARGIDRPVHNFGISGYNLRSSLRLASRMSRDYPLSHAVIYFLADDDIIQCDISCQKAMKKRDPAEYEEFKAAGLQEYMDAQHARFKELLAADFADIVRAEAVESGLTKRTRVIFYLLNVDGVEDLVLPVLRRHDIEFVVDAADCGGNRDACYVPGDGHPTARKNKEIADLLAPRIAPGTAQ